MEKEGQSQPDNQGFLFVKAKLKDKYDYTSGFVGYDSTKHLVEVIDNISLSNSSNGLVRLLDSRVSPGRQEEVKRWAKHRGLSVPAVVSGAQSNGVDRLIQSHIRFEELKENGKVVSDLVRVMMHAPERSELEPTMSDFRGFFYDETPVTNNRTLGERRRGQVRRGKLVEDPKINIVPEEPNDEQPTPIFLVGETKKERDLREVRKILKNLKK